MSALRLLHETARARRVRHRASSTSSPTSRTSSTCSASWTSRSRRCPSRGRGPARRRSTRSWRASGRRSVSSERVTFRSSSISASSSAFAVVSLGAARLLQPQPSDRRQAQELRVRRRADRRRLGAVPGRLLPRRAALHRLRRAGRVPVPLGARAARPRHVGHLDDGWSSWPSCRSAGSTPTGNGSSSGSKAAGSRNSGSRLEKLQGSPGVGAAPPAAARGRQALRRLRQRHRRHPQLSPAASSSRPSPTRSSTGRGSRRCGR